MSAQTVFLAFGSNLGNKQKNIETAYKKIEERIGKIISRSAFYVTEPNGFDSENIFVNSVCEVQSELSLCEILRLTQTIEKEIGRTSKSENLLYSDRLIDIDLLLADDLVVNTPQLTIPHPRLHLREFVLLPLCEIAPEAIHPILNKKMRELLTDLQDEKR